jgi:hypothetical protein
MSPAACAPAAARERLQTPVSAVKGVLEAMLNIPAARQRLIYRGRVLRDEQTMQDIGA